MTVPKAAGTLELTAPPVRKAIQLLENIGILTEVTGRRRGRAYAYQEYLQVLVGERE